MLIYAIYTVIAVMFATVAPFVLYRLAVNPLPIVYMFMGATVINALTVSPQPLRLGINLYLYDFICLICLACFGLRLFRGKLLSLFEPAAFLVIVLTISFFRGVSGYGTTAGVDYRLYIHAMTAMLLLSTCDFTPEQFRRIRIGWIVMATALTAIALYRWSVDLFGLPIERTWIGVGAENEIRVLDSTHALAIAMGALAALVSSRKGDIKMLLLANLLLLAVVILQHRSVWVSTIVGLAVLGFFAKSARPTIAKQAMVTAILVPVAFAIALAGGLDTSRLTDSLVKSTETAIKGETTVEAREIGWQGLLEGYNRAQTVDRVLGAPMGSGYLRFTRGVYDPRVPFSPHNFYLQVLLRGGILGIVLLFISLGLAVWRATQAAWHGGPIAHWLIATVFMSLAYFIPYGAPAVAGMALGLAQVARNSRGTDREAVPAGLPAT